ncbi:conserved hypothetical protein [Uncinocarpus reesii 1704]|uniref:phosphoinositide 5-phosphatase n=1 Tax=Uncinocarpus reesii (strain UAMH 1704) TaxID=336963 RepID=C4K056_UNCRE|nr:uncharacterized protein UREG_07807 [Uncinocarpus reesii 1704]EEP82942.1 conserved hypothetical protein [Uncinocarpus reesii 1704]
MSLRVLCKDHPQRSIALVTADNHALTLEYSPPQSESAASSGSYSNVVPPRCVVKFSRLSSLDDADHRLLGIGYGTLGLLTLNSDVFLCIIANLSAVANPRPNETVQRIENVEFYCLNRPDYDAVLDFYEGNASYSQSNLEADYGTAFQGKDTVTENPFLALKKLLSDGSFYYSTDFNLTNRMQDRVSQDAFDIESLDEDFLWNSYMIGPLLQFRNKLADHERNLLDSTQILTSVIRGFVQSMTIPASSPLLGTSRSHLPSTLTLISRLSSRRAGTRFNSRGIDDDGRVSNFVETETVLWIPPGITFSYIQVRGSIPIFWEQTPGLIPGQQKIQVTRSVGATQHAFDRHFEALQLDYGVTHVINLLSEVKPGEVELSERYRYHMRQSPLRRARDEGTSSAHHLLQWTDYDFHAETRGPAGYGNAVLIEHKLGPSIDGFAYFLSENSGSTTLQSSRLSDKPAVILQQEGVFRTNCLDCLDRTNLVQTLISRMVLERFLKQYHGTQVDKFWLIHSTLWADNGDMLSKGYAGTGALKSSFTRHGKMSLAGAIADARKSVTRLYFNNFTDNAKQNTIDILLGALTGQAAVHLYDPVNDLVRAELTGRSTEFSSKKVIRVWTGTFNVNGRPYDITENLGVWLHAHLSKTSEEPTLLAVGFQEIVELSPQQIMSTDPASRKVWEEAVKKALDEETSRRGTNEYILLRSGQLVGAALLLFVKKDALKEIKNVEGSVKKTGLSGMAGNKGGCAIRLEFSATRICFVTAHLAAGFANYEERNRDYYTIANGLRFQRNRTINDHDAVIWLGDLNYRVELNDDEYYSEGPITFPPTYRYNNGSDSYDTSEKRRIPAWCDRILWKGECLHQLEYNTAPLKMSDHRPVYAVFECMVCTVNEEVKASLSRELYEKHKRAIEPTGSPKSEHTEEGVPVRGYIAPGLSPAKLTWWLDNGLPVRSSASPPVGYVTSSGSRQNPFSALTEHDWVHIMPKGKDDKVPRRAKNENPLRNHSSPDNIMGASARGVLVDVGLTGHENAAGSKKETNHLQQLIEIPEPKKIPPPIPKKPFELSNPSQSFGPFSKSKSSIVTSTRDPIKIENSDSPRQTGDSWSNLPYRGKETRLLSGKMDNMEGTSHHRLIETRNEPDNSGLLDSEIDMGMAEWKPLQPRQ